METSTHETCTAPPALSDADRGRIIRRMMKDYGMEETQAAASFEETLRFLERCAAPHAGPLAPTPEIDKGWHVFLLYSRAYRAYCSRIGSGRFIDHEPTDAATCFVHCSGTKEATAECETPPCCSEC